MSIFSRTPSKPAPPDPEREAWKVVESTPRPAISSPYGHACWAGLQCLAAMVRLADSGKWFRGGCRHDAQHAAGYFLDAVSRVPNHHVRGALAEVRDLIHDHGHEQQAQDQAELRIGEPSTAAEFIEQFLAAIEGAEGKGLMPEAVDEMREMLAARCRAERDLETERERLLATDWSDPTPDSIPQFADLRDRLLKEARLSYTALTRAEREVYDVLRELPHGVSLSKAGIEVELEYLRGSHLEATLTDLHRRGILDKVGRGPATEWRLKGPLPDEAPVTL